MITITVCIKSIQLKCDYTFLCNPHYIHCYIVCDYVIKLLVCITAPLLLIIQRWLDQLINLQLSGIQFCGIC